MRTIDAAAQTPERVAEDAANIIQGGGTVIFPTDTVYGIGADPQRSDAIARIYDAKRRPHAKPLALHFATVMELLEYLDGNTLATIAARAFLPGPLTIIVRRPAFISQAVTAGMDTLGLRVPDHALCSLILERSGPLAATSANPSGAPAYVGNGRERETLPEADLFIDAGPTPMERESTVIDLSGPQPRLIREGSLPLERLRAVLGPIEHPFTAPAAKDHC